MWYRILPQLIREYNNRKHRTLKMSPHDASKPENYHIVYKTLYDHKRFEDKPKFLVGQRVRTSLDKKIFEKECTQAWSEQIYQIADIVGSSPIVYKLSQLNGSPVIGTFYEKQLRLTNQKIYRIEKVISRRTLNGKRQSLVKWRDYDDTYNSYIDEDTIHHGGV